MTNGFDFRARLKPKAGNSAVIFGDNNDQNILKPLIDKGGLVFPYTPTLSFSGQAMYDEFGFTHSNYSMPAYVRSAPSNIQITADFTAKTSAEASYLLAVMHFVKVISKSYFGAQGPSSSDLTRSRNGTPPPVMLFDYLGEYMFKNIPVVLDTYSFTLEKDIDYVPVIVTNSRGTINRETYVPVKINIAFDLRINYNTKKLRDNFDLDAFREGKYLGGNGKLGGFI